jgi:hypothetical protein
MAHHVTTFWWTIILAAFLLVVGLLVVEPVLAQVDTTSSTSTPDVASSLGGTTADATTSAPTLGEFEDVGSSSPDSTSTGPVLGESSAVASTSPDATTTASYASTPAAEPPPPGLTEVHVIGTKYTDYFTDGTNVTSYPGDPEVDGNLNKRDAPIPTHAGLTWLHTNSTYLYDTPSGNLDIGDYAVQSNGLNIENAPQFVSSTSTPTEAQVTSPPSDIPIAATTESSTTIDSFAHSNEATDTESDAASSSAQTNN